MQCLEIQSPDDWFHAHPDFRDFRFVLRLQRLRPLGCGIHDQQLNSHGTQVVATDLFKRVAGLSVVALSLPRPKPYTSTSPATAPNPKP